MTAAESDGLARAPWYVQVAIRVGMPTALASALLWFLLTNVTGAMNQVLANQLTAQSGTVQVIANQARIMELLAQTDRNNQRMMGLLAALCYNAAMSEAQRERCAMSVNTP